MSDVDPNRRPSNFGRYLFLLILGLVLGVIATVMAMRALDQRKDHFPDALMQVQQWHMGQLKADMDQNRCNATDILPHLQALRVTSNDIDAVAVVTPVSTHYELARKCLENGKHVFVEKPFTATVAQAEKLIELADKKKLTLMVDHTFLFTGAVRKMKELIDQKTLGTLHYYDSVRVNLGLFQHDINVVWDLAPHDLSIMDYLIDTPPEAVIAIGASHVNDLEDVAYITIYFPNNTIAHIHVNWLSPVKVRMTLIGGEHKMLLWNDLEADEKVKVYDKGAASPTSKGSMICW
jgi:predicted dehydrogenase